VRQTEPIRSLNLPNVISTTNFAVTRPGYWFGELQRWIAVTSGELHDAKGHHVYFFK